MISIIIGPKWRMWQMELRLYLSWSHLSDYGRETLQIGRKTILPRKAPEIVPIIVGSHSWWNCIVQRSRSSVGANSTFGFAAKQSWILNMRWEKVVPRFQSLSGRSLNTRIRCKIEIPRGRRTRFKVTLLTHRVHCVFTLWLLLLTFLFSHVALHNQKGLK